MRSKGISQMLVRLVIFWILIGVSFAMLFFYWRSQLESEHVIEENEVLVARKVLYAKVLLSSDMLTYTDENGIHKGVIDKNKTEGLASEKLFEAYSYHPDDISKHGYSHYVRIDVWDKGKKKFEPLKEFSQQPFAPKPIFGVGEVPITMSFPVAVRYSQDDVKLGKMNVDIIQSGVSRTPIISPIQ